MDEGLYPPFMLALVMWVQDAVILVLLLLAVWLLYKLVKE